MQWGEGEKGHCDFSLGLEIGTGEISTQWLNLFATACRCCFSMRFLSLLPRISFDFVFFLLMINLFIIGHCWIFSKSLLILLFMGEMLSHLELDINVASSA